MLASDRHVLPLALQVRKAGLKAIFVFIAPPSLAELEQRLRGRATGEQSTHMAWPLVPTRAGGGGSSTCCLPSRNSNS